MGVYLRLGNYIDVVVIQTVSHLNYFANIRAKVRRPKDLHFSDFDTLLLVRVAGEFEAFRLPKNDFIAFDKCAACRIQNQINAIQQSKILSGKEKKKQTDILQGRDASFRAVEKRVREFEGRNYFNDLEKDL